MKKTVFIMSLIALFSCAKEEVSTEVLRSNATAAQLKAVGMDFDFSTETESGCKNGESNCTSFCCVTPSLVADFMAAIDDDDLNDFLTTEKINALSNEDDFIKGLLEDAKVGEINVIYVTAGNKVGFMFGEGDVSSSNYDAVLALFI